jgi:phosphopantetheinyl transferase
LVNKLCEKLELGTIHECGFKKDSKGRPYFSNHPNLFLSITHSHGYVFVVVSNSPVGIDFEKIDSFSSEDLKIAFNELDWKTVSADLNSLFKYFSLKESYSKMIGTGFTTEPAEIQLVDIEKNSYYSFFEINGLRYVFTIITLHIEPEKFLNLQFNFST